MATVDSAPFELRASDLNHPMKITGRQSASVAVRQASMFFNGALHTDIDHMRASDLPEFLSGLSIPAAVRVIVTNGRSTGTLHKLRDEKYKRKALLVFTASTDKFADGNPEVENMQAVSAQTSTGGSRVLFVNDGSELDSMIVGTALRERILKELA